MFTGIGLEVHEAPYLNGGSTDIIQTGHTFSNEPGVYIEGVVSDICLYPAASDFLSLCVDRWEFASKTVFSSMKVGKQSI